MDDSDGKYASKTKLILGIMFKILDLACYKGRELPDFLLCRGFASSVNTLNFRSVLCTDILICGLKICLQVVFLDKKLASLCLSSLRCMIGFW